MKAPKLHISSANVSRSLCWDSNIHALPDGDYFLIPADKAQVEAVAKAICDGENREKYRYCSECQRWRDKLPAARAVLGSMGVEDGDA